MSKRRNAGDQVWKLPRYGLVGEAGYITLSGEPESCMLDCGDPDCQEWPDGETDNGNFAYHISECLMTDSAGEPATGR